MGETPASGGWEMILMNLTLQVRPWLGNMVRKPTAS